MIAWNIYRCELCKLHLIADERHLHVCIDIKDSRIEDDTKWVFDGKMWYPLKLRPHKVKKSSDESKHNKSSDGEVPEPQLILFLFNQIFSFHVPHNQGITAHSILSVII